MAEATNSAAVANNDEQTPIIFLDDIHVVFKTRTGSLLHPNKVHAVNGLSLKLMPGQTIGIVGESGCGKSTTANVMCGLQTPTSGHVYFKGTDVTKRTAAQRKIIGRDFVEVFNAEAKQIENVKWLAQGTIYPDVVESASASVKGPAAMIKSHHNVGGLPEEMHLKIVEPLRLLFKDEVRRVGKSLGIDPQLLGRHPFPGPGLAIRILGDITPEKVEILQNVDEIYIDALREWGLYDQVWQAGAILLPVKSVGVMGDERTYESCVALRAVASTDGMTADWVHLPYDFLAAVSNDIINKVRGVNRVVYDISSKPPATIEWE